MASEAGARTPERQDALTGSHQAEREARCAALVIGATLIAGPVTVAGKADEKTPIHHTWLTEKTKIALAADGRVKGRQIDIETTQGVVMLHGKVDSEAAKPAAGGITKMLDGVKAVKNDLAVVAPSKQEAVEEKDEAITVRVKESPRGFTRTGLHRRYMMRELNLSRTTAQQPSAIPHASQVGEQTGQIAQAFKRAAADHANIAQRAYELYEQRGRQDGRDLEDWVKAEREQAGALHHT